MFRVRFNCIALMSIAILVGNVAGQTAPNNPTNERSVTVANTASRLRIGPGDLLEMTVFDVPEMSQVIRVSDAGEGNVSLIGTVKLNGMTTGEAEELIATRLRTGNFLLNPGVHILIREYGTQGISILGEIRKPGIYQVLGRRTLLDVISEAGGLTPLAATKVTVQREENNKQTITADISNDAAKSLANDIDLHPGDKVVVPRAGIVYVIGDVGRPGGYLMQNNGELSLVQAIAMAAGANRTASAGHTRLLRKTATGVSEFEIDLKKVLKGKSADLELQAEDIVFVPTSGAKSILHRAPSIMQTAASAVIYSTTTGALN